MLDSDSGKTSHAADDNMYINTHVTNIILFKSWETTSWQELLLACLFTAAVGILYQKIVTLRDELKQENIKSSSADQASSEGDKSKQDKPSEERTRLTEKKGAVKSRCTVPSRHHLVQTVLYFIQVWLAIVSMLLVMTFNIYICLALTIGKTLGFFFFNWISEISSKRAVKTT